MLRVVIEVMPGDVELQGEALFAIIRSQVSVPGSSWLDWETQPIGFGLEALLAACLIDGDQGEITDCLLEKILNMSLGGDTLVQSAKLLSTGAYCGDGEGPAGAKWQAKRCEWDTNNHDWENFDSNPNSNALQACISGHSGPKDSMSPPSSRALSRVSTALGVGGRFKDRPCELRCSWRRHSDAALRAGWCGQCSIAVPINNPSVDDRSNVLPRESFKQGKSSRS